MNWYSLYGTGFTLHGIRRQPDGRVRFTAWVSVLWLPVIPWSSWSAVYAGEAPPDAITDGGPGFVDLHRIPHDWSQNLKTFVTGLILLALCVGPIFLMIRRTDGRAATTIEMIVLFTLIFAVVGFIIWLDRRRRLKLEGDPVAESMFPRS